MASIFSSFASPVHSLSDQYLEHLRQPDNYLFEYIVSVCIGRRHGYGWVGGYILRRQVATSIQHVALSLLRNEQAKRYHTIPRYIHLKLIGHHIHIITYNLNVHFVRNDPFSDTVTIM